MEWLIWKENNSLSQAGSWPKLGAVWQSGLPEVAQVTWWYKPWETSWQMVLPRQSIPTHEVMWYSNQKEDLKRLMSCERRIIFYTVSCLSRREDLQKGFEILVLIKGAGRQQEGFCLEINIGAAMVGNWTVKGLISQSWKTLKLKFQALAFW